MAVTFGSRELAKAVAILEEDHATAQDAAKAILGYAFELYEARAKFVVVGQLRHEDADLNPEDPHDTRVALGPFSTESIARSQGSSLGLNLATGEEARWWLVRMYHGTASAFYQERAQARKAEARKLDTTTTERERLLQRRVDWYKEHPGSMWWDTATRSWQRRDPSMEIPDWLTDEAA